jgi:hypothetical protein
MTEQNQLHSLSLGRRRSIDGEPPVLEQRDSENREGLHADT